MTTLILLLVLFDGILSFIEPLIHILRSPFLLPNIEKDTKRYSPYYHQRSYDTTSDGPHVCLGRSSRSRQPE